MKTEVQSGDSAMLNWGQKVYPTNIRLCAWNTSVTNSHTIPICGQHDYSPNYKKNTLSSLEVRQLLFSLYATPVCHRAVLGLPAKAFAITYKQLATPVHPGRWARQSGQLLRSLLQVTGSRRPSWKPSQQLADSQLRRRKTKVDLNKRSIERRLSLPGVAKVHQVDCVCPDYTKKAQRKTVNLLRTSQDRPVR